MLPVFLFLSLSSTPLSSFSLFLCVGFLIFPPPFSVRWNGGSGWDGEFLFLLFFYRIGIEKGCYEGKVHREINREQK